MKDKLSDQMLTRLSYLAHLKIHIEQIIFTTQMQVNFIKASNKYRQMLPFTGL